MALVSVRMRASSEGRWQGEREGIEQVQLIHNDPFFPVLMSLHTPHMCVCICVHAYVYIRICVYAYICMHLYLNNIRMRVYTTGHHLLSSVSDEVMPALLVHILKAVVKSAGRLETYNDISYMWLCSLHKPMNTLLVYQTMASMKMLSWPPWGIC